MTVGSASADLALTAGTGLFGLVPGGSVAFMTCSFKNNGNVAVKGNATVVLYAKFEDGSEQQLGIADVNFKLNPGDTAAPKKPLAFNIPASKSVNIAPSRSRPASRRIWICPTRSRTTSPPPATSSSPPTPTPPTALGRNPHSRDVRRRHRPHGCVPRHLLRVGPGPDEIELGDYLDAEGNEGTYTFGLPARRFTFTPGGDEDAMGVAGTLSTKSKLGGRAITFGVPKKGCGWIGRAGRRREGLHQVHRVNWGEGKVSGRNGEMCGMRRMHRRA